MQKKNYLLNIVLFLFFLVHATWSYGQEEIKLLEKKNFEREIGGKKVDLYVLRNVNDIVAEITNYGGRVVSLWVPDRNGKYSDIVLGYPTLDGYLNSSEKYFGALIGRYGNRIANGRFSLDGQEYVLATNNGANHLHGGDEGFDAVIWDAKQIDKQTLQLTYVSKHLEEGYPGKLEMRVRYFLSNENELTIEYWATSDRPTVVNLTHHSFFNLAGAGNGTINDHILQINAPYYTPVDADLIPTGIIATVENTPMDFRKPTHIGQRLNETFEQLEFGQGYDHNYVLNQNLDGLYFAAKVVEPDSGRTMKVYTNEPGLQFYGGNFLDGSIVGKQNNEYGHRTAFCLETQHFPDSPNHPHFPSTRLNPEEDYYSICVYEFSKS